MCIRDSFRAVCSMSSQRLLDAYAMPTRAQCLFDADATFARRLFDMFGAREMSSTVTRRLFEAGSVLS
eukprot:2573906-Lingulodinium_polyedra.AAC.1